MRVIGIDPGSRYTGYGVIDKDGQRLVHVASGRINASSSTLSFGARLDTIYTGLISVMAEFEPESVAVETVFAAKNVQSTIKLGQARGVVLLAIQHSELEYSEYSPASVKNSVTGHGRADKASVGILVRKLLNLDAQTDISEDAVDALAVAICHCHLRGFEQKLRD